MGCGRGIRYRCYNLYCDDIWVDTTFRKSCRVSWFLPWRSSDCSSKFDTEVRSGKDASFVFIHSSKEPPPISFLFGCGRCTLIIGGTEAVATVEQLILKWISSSSLLSSFFGRSDSSSQQPLIVDKAKPESARPTIYFYRTVQNAIPLPR